MANRRLTGWGGFLPASVPPALEMQSRRDSHPPSHFRRLTQEAARIPGPPSPETQRRPLHPSLARSRPHSSLLCSKHEGGGIPAHHLALSLVPAHLCRSLTRNTKDGRFPPSSLIPALPRHSPAQNTKGEGSPPTTSPSRSFPPTSATPSLETRRTGVSHPPHSFLPSLATLLLETRRGRDSHPPPLPLVRSRPPLPLSCSKHEGRAFPALHTCSCPSPPLSCSKHEGRGIPAHHPSLSLTPILLRHSPARITEGEGFLPSFVTPLLRKRVSCPPPESIPSCSKYEGRVSARLHPSPTFPLARNAKGEVFLLASACFRHGGFVLYVVTLLTVD